MSKRWMFIIAALFCATPSSGIAQERFTGTGRSVLRVNAGLPVEPTAYQLHVGLEGDFGLTNHASLVLAARRWGYGNFECLYPGPVADMSTSATRASDACRPDGWSISGGLRGALPLGRGQAAAYDLVGEVDLGLYRYDHDQAFVTPYGGVRAGLAATLWSAVEVQIARHVILVSSYNSSGFDPDRWQLGSWDVGIGIPIS